MYISTPHMNYTLLLSIKLLKLTESSLDIIDPETEAPPSRSRSRIGVDFEYENRIFGTRNQIIEYPN